MILIVGVGRSGTTLIREILNKHPDVNIAPETSFYNRLWAARKLLGSIKLKHNIPKWIYYLLFHSHDPSMENYKHLFSNLMDSFERKLPSSHEEMFERIIKIFAECKGKKIYGEKTPNHIFYIDYIKRKFPTAKVIVTIRDPRAVTASMIKRGDLYHQVHQPALEWHLAMKKVIKIIENHESQVLVIRYEHLVENSYNVVKKLCDFLNLDFREDMLYPEDTNTSFKELKGKKGIYKEAKSKWKEVLSKREVETIERICGDLMSKFGYTPEKKVRHYLTHQEWKFKTFIESNLILGKLGLRPFRAYLNNIFAGRIKL